MSTRQARWRSGSRFGVPPLVRFRRPVVHFSRRAGQTRCLVRSKRQVEQVLNQIALLTAQQGPAPCRCSNHRPHCIRSRTAHGDRLCPRLADSHLDATLALERQNLPIGDPAAPARRRLGSTEDHTSPICAPNKSTKSVKVLRQDRSVLLAIAEHGTPASLRDLALQYENA